jgi:hypothetical protein
VVEQVIRVAPEIDQCLSITLGVPIAGTLAARPPARPAHVHQHGPRAQVLTVHGERNSPSGDDVELLIGERPTGGFSRQRLRAETVDSGQIGADQTTGILRPSDR